MTKKDYSYTFLLIKLPHALGGVCVVVASPSNHEITSNKHIYVAMWSKIALAQRGIYFSPEYFLSESNNEPPLPIFALYSCTTP